MILISLMVGVCACAICTFILVTYLYICIYISFVLFSCCFVFVSCLFFLFVFLVIDCFDSGVIKFSVYVCVCLYSLSAVTDIC